MHDSIEVHLPRDRGVRRRAGRTAGIAVPALILLAACLLAGPTSRAAGAGSAPTASGGGAAGAPAGAAAPAGPETIASLAWLAGSWSGESGGLAMEEHWIAPSGGALLGMHRDVKNGRMVEFEFLRIEVSGGTVTYWASPRSAPPTPFRLKELGPGQRVVFENPEHDFPQRILYWRTDDGLHARVEGPSTTGEKAMEWAWRPMASAR